MLVQELGESVATAAAGAGGFWFLMKRLNRQDKTADSAADALVAVNGAVERIVGTLREELERLAGVNLLLVQQLTAFQVENVQLKSDVLALTDRLKDYAERNSVLAIDVESLNRQVENLHDILKSIG